MINLAKRSRLVSALYWHIGRFEVLVGVAMLTVASAIMAISRKGNPTEVGNPALTMLRGGVCATPPEGN